MKSFPVSQPLFEALVAHYRRCREEAVPRTQLIYPRGYCISYQMLIERANVPLKPRNAGGPLNEIASFCWPTYGVPLHALVVNKELGYPGGDLDKSYWGSPGASEDPTGWLEVDVPTCLNATTVPLVAPKLPGFA
jgi:hypothetical protein